MEISEGTGDQDDGQRAPQALGDQCQLAKVLFQSARTGTRPGRAERGLVLALGPPQAVGLNELFHESKLAPGLEQGEY